MLSNNLSKTYLCGGYLRLSKEDGDVAGSETLQSNSIENQKNILKIIYIVNRRLRLSISMLMMVIVA